MAAQVADQGAGEDRPGRRDGCGRRGPGSANSATLAGPARTGIRITAVTQIAVATVAAYISAGGLGDIIFQGITQDFGDKIVAGAVLTSLLAIVVDESLKLVERRLRASMAEQL